MWRANTGAPPFQDPSAFPVLIRVSEANLSQMSGLGAMRYKWR